MQLFGKKLELALSEERSLLLICIGISLFIWTMMKLSGEFKTTRSVQLEYDLPDMMEFVAEPPEKVTATLQGSGLSLIGNFIRNPNPSIIIDLQDKVGRNIERFELLASTRDLFGVEVIDIDLNYLELEVDSMFNKKVPVELVHELKFATDFFPTNGFALSPDSVFISGTPGQVSRIFSVKTEKVSSKPLFENWSKNVQLQPPEKGTVKVAPSQINVSVEVEQFTEKNFEVPIKVPETKDSIHLIPAVVEARCVVPLSRFAELSFEDFEIVVASQDSIGLSEQNIVPLHIAQAPTWLWSVELTPSVVEYFIVQ